MKSETIEEPCLMVGGMRIPRLSPESFAKIEEQIGKECQRHNYNAQEARGFLWEPISSAIINRMGSHPDERGIVREEMEKVLVTPEDYMRSNLMMELARYAVLNQVPFMDGVRLRSAVIVYDPFAPITKKPTVEAIERVGWDAGTGPFIRREEEILLLERQDPSLAQKLKVKEKRSIPHLVPGLGSMTAVSQFTITNLPGLSSFISHVSGGTETSEFIPSRPIEWLKENCDSMGIRLVFIHLSYGLRDARPLIKVIPSTGALSMRMKDTLMDAELVRETRPFILPSNRVSVLSEGWTSDPKPYTVIGAANDGVRRSVGIILDYGDTGDDSTRYLPLLPILYHSGNDTTPIPSHIFIPKSPDMGLLSSVTHINFIRSFLKKKADAATASTKVATIANTRAVPARPVPSMRLVDGEEIPDWDKALVSLAKRSKYDKEVTALYINCMRYNLRKAMEHDMVSHDALLELANVDPTIPPPSFDRIWERTIELIDRVNSILSAEISY